MIAEKKNMILHYVAHKNQGSTKPDSARFSTSPYGRSSSPRSCIGTDFAEIDFAFKITDYNVAEVRENNVYKWEVRYNTGDIFRIADENGVVKYYHNGSLLYVSQKRPTYPLIADTVFVAMNGRINNAVIGALSINAAAEWPMYQRDPAHTGYAVA